MSGQDLTIAQAIRDSLYTEMNLDDEVLVMGEGVGKDGNVFRATEDLWDEFGDDRIINTSLAESGIVGIIVGMATVGLKPVPEIQFSGLMYPGFGRIVSHMGRFRNRTRGRYTFPMVLRTPYGGGTRIPESHSESKEVFCAHEAGLKVVIPSMSYGTKGLLIFAARDLDPVILMGPRLTYQAFRGEVPGDDYAVPIGKVAVRREGTNVSMLTFGAMARPTLEAIENLKREGINTEIVNIRAISSLDHEAIIESFKRTDHAVVVHKAPKNGGLGAKITTTVQEETLLYQEVPVKRVAGYDVPYPLYALEDYYLPSVARVEEDIREAMNF